MKRLKIKNEHIPVLKEYCAYIDGYTQGVQDSAEKLKLRLIEILAAQSPASGADQEPKDADSRLPDAATQPDNPTTSSAT